MFDFETFWRDYPRKVGRIKAQRIWNRMRVMDKQKCMDGLPDWINSLEWQDIMFVPYPSTFLNQRRYEEKPAFVVRQASDRRIPTPEQNQRDKQAIAEILAKHPELA